jgi:hypothetical protein
MNIPVTKPLVPTPSQVLDQIVAQFAVPNDPELPFLDNADYAKRKLASLMLREAYGMTSPISQFVQWYTIFDRTILADRDRYEHILEKLSEFWSEIEQEVIMETPEPTE